MSLRRARSLSALTTFTSFIFLAAGLVSLLFNAVWHMKLMISGLLAFASGVNISFLAALSRKSPSAAVVHSVNLILLPLLPYQLMVISFSITGLLMTLLSGRRDFYAGVIAYSYLAPLLALPYKGVPFFLWLAWSHPVALIYAVSLHSLPKTYRYKYDRLLAYTSLAAHLYALLRGEPFFASLSELLYFLSLRLDKVLPSLRRVRGEARKAHNYLISAYLLLTPVIVFSFFGLRQLSYLHLLLLGFIGLHVYGHAPMMLPVIFGVRNARSFTPLPLIMLTLSALTWPFHREIALYLLLGSLPLLASIVALES